MTTMGKATGIRMAITGKPGNPAESMSVARAIHAMKITTEKEGKVTAKREGPGYRYPFAKEMHNR